MSQSDWLRLAALLLAVLLILPAALRLPRHFAGRGSRLLLFIAIWLAIFAVVAVAYQWFG
jgi:hypothetical protein